MNVKYESQYTRSFLVRTDEAHSGLAVKTHQTIKPRIPQSFTSEQ